MGLNHARSPRARVAARAAALAFTAALAAVGATSCVTDRETKVEAKRDIAFAIAEEAERYLAAGNYVRARDKFLQAAEISPRPAFLYKIGHCHYQLGNLDQSIAYFQRALDAAPDYELAKAEMDLARMQLREKEIAMATPRENPEATTPSPAPYSPPSASAESRFGPSDPTGGTRPVTPVPTPTATPTPIASYTPIPTPFPRPTPRATPTPAPTPEPTETPEPSPTPEPTPTFTPKPTPTPAPTATPTPRPTPTPAPTATPPPTPSPTPRPTPRPQPTISPIRTPIRVEPPAEVATATPTATPAPSPRPVATSSVASSKVPRFEGKPPEVTSGGGTGFDGFGSAFSTLSGKNEDKGRTGKVDELDMGEARSAIFPELQSAPAAPNLDNERRLAAEAEHLGRWDEATRRWRRVSEANPGDIDARLSFGRSLSRTGQTRRAGEEFENIARAHPDSDLAWFEYGNFLSLVDEFDRSRDAYERALELNSANVEARNNLGALHVKQKEYGNARVVLNELNEKWPDYAPGWLNRAILEDEGRKDDAAALRALENYLRLGGRQTDTIQRWQARLRASVGGASYEGATGG